VPEHKGAFIRYLSLRRVMPGVPGGVGANFRHLVGGDVGDVGKSVAVLVHPGQIAGVASRVLIEIPNKGVIHHVPATTGLTVISAIIDVLGPLHLGVHHDGFVPGRIQEKLPAGRLGADRIGHGSDLGAIDRALGSRDRMTLVGESRPYFPVGSDVFVGGTGIVGAVVTCKEGVDTDNFIVDETPGGPADAGEYNPGRDVTKDIAAMECHIPNGRRTRSGTTAPHGCRG